MSDPDAAMEWLAAWDAETMRADKAEAELAEARAEIEQLQQHLRIAVALHRSAEEDVNRVIALVDDWEAARDDLSPSVNTAHWYRADTLTNCIGELRAALRGAE